MVSRRDQDPADICPQSSIEKSVRAYFSGKAKQRGIQLSELLAEVLKRDIEINEAGTQPPDVPGWQA